MLPNDELFGVISLNMLELASKVLRNVIKKQVNGAAPSNRGIEGEEKKKEKSFEGRLSSEFVDRLAKKKDFNGESKHIITR